MRAYLEPFAAYVFLPLLLGLLGLDELAILVVKLLVTGGLLYIHRKAYAFELRPSPIALLAGVAIFAVWVGLDGWYPFFLGEPTGFDATPVMIVLHLMSALLLAPVVEEFFTRFFLNRVLQKNNWEKVPLARFTLASFVVTTLFFGFAHTRWLPGLLTGAALNLLLMKTGKMGPIVQAHFVANLLLFSFAAYTQNWTLLG